MHKIDNFPWLKTTPIAMAAFIFLKRYLKKTKPQNNDDTKVRTPAAK